MQTRTAHYFSGKVQHCAIFCLNLKKWQQSLHLYLKQGSWESLLKKVMKAKNWQTSSILFLFKTMWMISNFKDWKMNLLNKYTVSGICTDWFDKSVSKQRFTTPCSLKPPDFRFWSPFLHWVSHNSCHSAPAGWLGIMLPFCPGGGCTP